MKRLCPLLLLCLHACVNAAISYDANDPELGEEREALTGETGAPADLPARCSKNDLTWSSANTGACSASWDYERKGLCWQAMPQEYTLKPQDTMACTAWANCRDWCFADETSPWTFAGSSATYVVEKICPEACWYDNRGRKHCDKPTCNDPDAEAQNLCQSTYVPPFVTQKQAELPANRASKVVGLGTAVYLGNSTYRCDVQLQFPVAGPGVGSLCGCGTYTPFTPVACTSRPSTGLRLFSSAGLTHAGLLAEDPDAFDDASAPPRCTSCEQLPMDTPEQIRAKFQCLCDSWNRIPGVASCRLTPPAQQALAARVIDKTGIAKDDLVAVDVSAGKAGKIDIGPIKNLCKNSTVIRPPDDASIVEFRGPGQGQLDETQIPAFVRNFRLLMELGGDHLTDYARGFLRQLYLQYPSYEHGCSASPTSFETRPKPALPETSSAIPSSCPTPLAEDLADKLATCEHLALPHVTREVALIEQGQCLAFLDSLNALDATSENACDGAGLRKSARQAVTTMLAKSLKLLSSSPASTYGALPRQLFSLSRWWEAFRRSHAHDVELDPEPEEPADPVATLSDMLGRFWKEALEGRAVLTGLRTTLDPHDSFNPTVQQVEQAIGTSNQNAESLDRAVLTAALTSVTSLPEISEGGLTVLPAIDVSGPPLRGYPLVILAGDALARLSGHLDALTPLHDFACRFSDCRAPGFSSPTVRLTALLGSIAASETLTAELALVPASDDLGGWRAVFDALSTSYATFKTALSDLHLSNLLGVPSAGAHPSAGLLISAVQRQRDRIASFRARGLFDATDRRALYAGVDDLVRTNVLSRMNSRIQALARDQTKLSDDLASMANGLLEAASTAQARDDILQRQSVIFEEIDRQTREIQGLRGSGDAERTRLGDITIQLTRLDGTYDANQVLVAGNSVIKQLSGADAHYVPGPGDKAFSSIAAFSMAGQSMEGVRLVSEETAHRWSPTCAVRNVQALLPDPAHPGKLKPQKLGWEGALVGPEGFFITESQGQAVVQSSGHNHEDGWTTSVGNHFETCVGASLSLIGNSQSAFNLGLSAKDCATWDENYSSRNVNTSSNGSTSDVNSTASYAVGLRLPNLPIPEAPAGALIAVVAPRDALNLSADYPKYVISEPYTTLVLPEQSSVHFIVNDIVCPEGQSADSFNLLQLSARPLTTVGAVADAVVAQMALTLKTVRQRMTELKSQGSILPSQLAQIRTAAQFDLESNAHVAFSSLPPSLQNLFASHLDLSLLDLEREVEIQARQQSIHRLQVEATGLANDIAHVDQRGRLALLVPLWHLHALPERHLAAALSDLLGDVDHYLLPIMQLWYPHSMDGAASSALNTGVQTLINATPSTRFVDLVGQVVTVVQDALSRFEDANAWNRPYDTHGMVALSWDLPTVVANPTKSPFRRAQTPTTGPSELGVDPVSAIRDAKTGIFRVTPEDLYSRNGGIGGVLWCQESVPVISRMALFVGRTGSTGGTSDALNGQKRWISGRVSSVRFQTDTSLVPYAVDDTNRDEFAIPVIFGTPGSALDTFDRLIGAPTSAYEIGAAGMSPFADFALDFQGLADARSNPADNDGFVSVDSSNNVKFQSSEAILVMKLDSRPINQAVAGVTRCLAPNAATPNPGPPPPPPPPPPPGLPF